MKQVAILAVLVVLALSGCGGGDGETADGGEATEQQTTETTETDTTETTETDTTEPETTEQPEPPETDEVLPPGGKVPKLGRANLAGAARAAGCELQSFQAKSRQHTSDTDDEIDYSSAPPTSGKHLDLPAEDAAYLRAPDVTALVHSMEHGRVVIWFKGDLPPRARASLRAFYEDDPQQTLLTPDETGSDYAVAATAWNRDPMPNGTGRLLGCKQYTPKVFKAVQAFKQRHRGKGPEAIP